jgi:hypothetical protein
MTRLELLMAEVIDTMEKEADDKVGLIERATKWGASQYGKAAEHPKTTTAALLALLGGAGGSGYYAGRRKRRK